MLVHQGIGFYEQRFDGPASSGIELGGTHAGGQPIAAIARLVALVHGAANAHRERVALGDGRVEHQRHELVSTQARHDVAGAERFAQDLGRVDQRAVAFVVPELVVDLLHPVQIDEEEQRAPGFALREPQLLPAELHEPAAIVQAREIVSDRLATNGLGQFFGRLARALALHDASELRADVGHHREQTEIRVFAALGVELEHGHDLVLDQHREGEAADQARSPGGVCAQELFRVIQVREPGREPRAQDLADHAHAQRELERRALSLKPPETCLVFGVPPARALQRLTLYQVHVSDGPAHERTHAVQTGSERIRHITRAVRGFGDRLQELDAVRFLARRTLGRPKLLLDLLVRRDLVDERHAGDDHTELVPYRDDGCGERAVAARHLELFDGAAQGLAVAIGDGLGALGGHDVIEGLPDQVRAREPHADQQLLAVGHQVLEVHVEQQHGPVG